MRDEDDGFGVQRLREHFGQRQSLGHVERRLDAFARELEVAVEEHEPTDLRHQRREILVRSVLREDLVGAVHRLEPLLEAPAVPHDLCQAGRDASSLVCCTGRLEESNRSLEMRRRLVGARTRVGHHAGVLVEVGLNERVVGQLDRPLERALGLRVGGE